MLELGRIELLGLYRGRCFKGASFLVPIATGAAAGFAYGGPWGAAAGAGLGLMSSMAGEDQAEAIEEDRRRAQQQNDEANRRNQEAIDKALKDAEAARQEAIRQSELDRALRAGDADKARAFQAEQFEYQKGLNEQLMGAEAGLRAEDRARYDAALGRAKTGYEEDISRSQEARNYWQGIMTDPTSLPTWRGAADLVAEEFAKQRTSLKGQLQARNRTGGIQDKLSEELGSAEASKLADMLWNTTKQAEQNYFNVPVPKFSEPGYTYGGAMPNYTAASIPNLSIPSLDTDIAPYLATAQKLAGVTGVGGYQPYVPYPSAASYIGTSGQGLGQLLGTLLTKGKGTQGSDLSKLLAGITSGGSTDPGLMTR